MQKRRALLIGVPEYRDEAIDSFPDVVRQDIDNLEKALRLSGFHDISIHGLNDPWESTRPRILDRIEHFLGDATDGDTLIVYLSGHGLHHNGVDYLVPAEALIRDPSKYDQYLIKLDFAHSVQSSKAKTIIFFIDACRQGIKLKQKASYAAGWGKADREKVQNQYYLMVFACEPGEFAQYITGDTSFSLFTQALAKVIAPDHPAKTLGEVLIATDDELAKLTSQYVKNRQRIRKDIETGASEEEVLRRVVCEGSVTVSVSGSVSWLTAANNAEIWSSANLTNDPNLSLIKDAVAVVVEACWQQWLLSCEVLRTDPWRDERLPLRTLDCISLLIHRSNPKTELTASECALITVAPFIREAVIAAGVARATTANPFSLETTGATEGPRGELEKTYLLFPQLVRKARRLEALGQEDARDSLAAWLMYRCVLRLPSLWLSAPTGTLPKELETSLRLVSRSNSSVLSDVFEFNRMIEFAHSVFGDPERVRRGDRPGALQPEAFLGGQAPDRRVREQLLGYLLVIAGRLAIDPRLLSDVVVDHFGLTDSLAPKDVLNCINHSHWARAGKILSLSVRCYHQAIDLALHDYVQDSFLVLNAVTDQADTSKPGLEAISDLPIRLTADGVKPALDANGRTVYETPLIRFHLAQDEVRELLMGDQLYGDPNLAIRELYQNALDACRYRRARLEFLERTGQLSPAVSQWKGLIIFRQGIDDEGRPFVECEDNGIGMGRRELSECFAKAGRRFHDTPEFIEEQAEWRKCNPPVELYPNSQFGIGVFSYFMLSDELHVETCRLDGRGFPGTGLTALVSGSGTLFRVTEHPEASADAGTKIRLYLNRTLHNGKRISCVDTLRELLWVAEFHLIAHDGAESYEWESDVLRHPNLPPQQIIAGSSPNLWWVTSSVGGTLNAWDNNIGALLADGLHTGPKDTSAPMNFIVNLKAAKRPVLSVDRKKILKWDKAWVQKLLANGWHTLLDWPRLTLSWLWLLERESPDAAEQLTLALAESDANVSIGFVSWHVHDVDYNSSYRNSELVNEREIKFRDLGWATQKVPVREVGCVFSDIDLFGYIHRLSTGSWTLFDEVYRERQWKRRVWSYDVKRQRVPDWLMTYRVALFKRLGIITALPKWLEAERIDLPENFPTILPNDTEILNKLQDKASLLKMVAATGETFATTLQRLKRLSPLGVEFPIVNISSFEDATITQDELSSIRHDQVMLAWVLKTAATSGEPVESLLESLLKLTPFGIALPNVTSKAIANIIEDKSNLELFDNHGNITTNSILIAAAKIKEPLSATLQRAEKFSALGFSIPQIRPETFDGLMVEDHVRQVFNHSNGFGESILTGIAHSSAITGETVGRIACSLEKLRPFKIDIPELDVEKISDLVISTADLRLLSYPYETITIRQILTVSAELDEPVNTTYERAVRLAKLGLTLTASDLSNVSIRVSAADLQAVGDSPTISTYQLLRASLKAGQAVLETYERLQGLAPIGIHVQEIVAEIGKDFRVSEEDDFLIWSDNKLTIIRLLAAACILQEPLAKIFERAKRLTRVGVAIPHLSTIDLKLSTIDREDFLSLVALGIIREVSKTKSINPEQNLMARIYRTLTNKTLSEPSPMESDIHLLSKVEQYLRDSTKWASAGRGAGILHLAKILDDVDFQVDAIISRTELVVAALVIGESFTMVSARLRKFETLGLQIHDS